MMPSFLLVILILISLDSGIALRENRLLIANVTHTLDSLLAVDRYDKRLRPGFGGPPATISVNLVIKSMGPVSENDQSFSLDCYFRQQWYDLRLQFKKLPGLEEFSMSWLFLDKVWKPDTYFVNGKKSFLHRITAPNKFLRLRYDGFITYSMRLTITATCPMYLRKFPLDAQRCPLVIGSYGYTNKDLLYRWTKDKTVELEPNVELAQFDLVNTTTEEEKTTMRGTLEYSTVQANFWLKRHTGYFMLQVYIPCGIIVTCSWISFWIDPDAVPVYVPCGLIVLSSWVSFWIDPDDVAARVALGVTTVLSLTTMGFGGRAQLPKVSYWTALDWFVIICFTSVFSVMIEYAIVNFLDKFTKDFKKIIQDRKKKTETPPKEEIKVEPESKTGLKLEEPTPRKRSASFSVMSTVEEQPCRRISVGYVPTPVKKLTVKRENIFGSKFNIPEIDKSLNVIRDIPRRLSATVKDFINISDLQNRISKSILNLAKPEELEEDFPRDIPKVIVTKLDNEDLIDLDAEITETEIEPVDMIFDIEEEEKEEKKSEEAKLSFVKRLNKNLKDLWYKVKILPREIDIIKLLEDPDPPDKFSKIDIQARRSFPATFFISLMIYLFAFSYYLTDDFPERDMDLVLYKN